MTRHSDLSCDPSLLAKGTIAHGRDDPFLRPEYFEARDCLRAAGIDPSGKQLWRLAGGPRRVELSADFTVPDPPLCAPAWRAASDLYFSTTPPPDRSTMTQTRNPHDRRNPPRGDGEAMFGTLSSARELANSTGVSMGDIDGLVRRKESRAFEAGQQSTVGDQSRALQTAKREAWDAGHAAGERDGEAQICLTFSKHLFEGADRASSRASALLRLMSEDPKRVTKAELELALDNARDALVEILHAHAMGFDPEHFMPVGMRPSDGVSS